MEKRGIHRHQQIIGKIDHCASMRSRKEQRITEQFEKEYKEKLEQKRKNQI